MESVVRTPVCIYYVCTIFVHIYIYHAFIFSVAVSNASTFLPNVQAKYSSVKDVMAEIHAKVATGTM